MKNAKNSVYLLITLVVLIILFKKADIYRIFEIINNSDKTVIGIASFIALINVTFIASAKHLIFIRAFGFNIRIKELIKMRLGSIPVKAMTPGKAGIIMRPVYLKKNISMPYKTGFIIMLIELLLNLTGVMIIFIFTSLISMGNKMAYITTILIALSIIIVFRVRIIEIIKFIFRNKIRKIEKDYGEKIESTSSKIPILIPLLLSVVFISVQLTALSVIFNSLDIDIGLMEIFQIGSAVILISSLPISINGIGAREALVCFLFAGYSSYETLFMAGLIFTLTVYMVPVFIGLFFMKGFLKKTI